MPFEKATKWPNLEHKICYKMLYFLSASNELNLAQKLNFKQEKIRIESFLGQYTTINNSILYSIGENVDGRPSLFGGSIKKKAKSNNSSGDEPMPLSPSNTFLESTVDLKECYSMTTKPRGFFMLVNNKHFLPSSGK